MSGAQCCSISTVYLARSAVATAVLSGNQRYSAPMEVPPVQLRPSWSWRRSRLRQTAVPRYPKTTDAFVRPAPVGGWVDWGLTKARTPSYYILRKARMASLLEKLMDKIKLDPKRRPDSHRSAARHRGVRNASSSGIRGRCKSSDACSDI